MALEYLDLSGLQHFKERQDLSNAATFATTSYVTQLVGSVTAGVYQYKGSKATVAELLRRAIARATCTTWRRQV